MSPDDRQIAKRLGRVVRKLRDEKEWSQITLAEKADLNFNYVGSIERGEKLASVATVARLGRALGASGAELMRRADL
ncbi:helix-turn-helix domain-containing protein [Oleiharenicola lentus]|uniref:helix-turn-helix domain-containing protein n=1 Tax=Oleiharenicola lentus TaxID=2508720 RepID=UPI003F674851